VLHATPNRILFDLIILIILDEKYKSRSSSLHSFLYPPVILHPPLFDPIILLSTLFSHTLLMSETRFHTHTEPQAKYIPEDSDLHFLSCFSCAPLFAPLTQTPLQQSRLHLVSLFFVRSWRTIAKRLPVSVVDLTGSVGLAVRRRRQPLQRRSAGRCKYTGAPSFVLPRRI
jgi:hypothetical protein